MRNDDSAHGGPKLAKDSGMEDLTVPNFGIPVDSEHK